MIHFRQAASKRPRLTALVVSVATALSLFEGVAAAQVRDSRAAAPAAVDVADGESPVGTPPRRERRAQPLRDALSTIDYGSGVRQRLTGVSVQGPSSGRRRSVTRKILGGAIGATAGFFAGGYLGAAIEGDRCHCDDPGLQGVLIGAPIGAAVGGILGAMFF